jgi:hypothetical protein
VSNTEVLTLDVGDVAECAIDELEGAVCVSRVSYVLVWARAHRETSLGLLGLSDQASAILTAGVQHVSRMNPTDSAASASPTLSASPSPNPAAEVLAQIQSLGIRCTHPSAGVVQGSGGYENGVCDGRKGQIEVLIFKTEWARNDYESSRLGEPDFATGARYFLATGKRTLIILPDTLSAGLLQDAMGGCVVDQQMTPLPGYCPGAEESPPSTMDPDAGV